MTALAVLSFSAVAAAVEPAVSPPAGANGAVETSGERSRSHLVLSAVVAAAFLVMGAVAGRRKGGPASRRSLRPSSRRPL